MLQRDVLRWVIAQTSVHLPHTAFATNGFHFSSKEVPAAPIGKVAAARPAKSPPTVTRAAK